MRIYFPIFLSLLSFSRLLAQQDDFVKTEGMVSAFHRANTGRIFFTDHAIATREMQQADCMDTYELTNKSNLFISVFMGNSITNYMHQLAPALSGEALVKAGNYQFSLYVDGRLVYESNLLPGAPYASIQDTATTIGKPLIDNGHDGLWSQSFWNRFMYHGGDSALTDGKHLLKMEIRSYVRLADSVKTGALIATGQLKLVVNRKPQIDISVIHLKPVKPYDGILVSSDKFDSNRIKELKARIEDWAFKKINGIVILKNGKLLVEEYFNGEDRQSLHDPRSVGKSFASSITGIAIRDGYLKSEYQTLNGFYDLKKFANYAHPKDTISIRDLLTMSASLDGDDEDGNSPGNEENMYPTTDWVRFALDLPLNSSRPQGQWHYFTAGVIVLGDLLNKTVPGGLEKYAEQKLFQPLHITRYQWQYTPQQVPNTAGGIQLNALDFAKYGQLYKNEGLWNGQQVIPKDWVRKSFSKQKTITGRHEEYYGYLFWNKKYRAGKREYETFYCAGNGGNSIFIFKDIPLVVVITASAYGAAYAHPQVDKIMTEYILPAIDP